MDDSMEDSVFNVDASSDFEPAAKPKAKAVVKKSNASKTKATKAAPKPKKRAKAVSDAENTDGEDDNADHDISQLSNTPPVKAKAKKLVAPKPKNNTTAPLKEIMNESFGLDGADDDVPVAQPKKKANATEQYQKLTQLEHILKRPDTYIGSVERTEQQMWVYNSEFEAMENRKVSFVPGLYKIFDEILVNAADNKQRDKNMNEMKVWVNKAEGSISVRNNGRGIPIETHAKEGIWIPEMIFGHLLTSSNYDDEEAKVTGGRNGYGAKLTNIYSTKFELETVDSNQKKRYRQTWTDNMSKMEKAKITSASSDKDYTRITFWPDFSKFGMTEMDDDFEALVKRRVYDMAGTCKDVKVFLNDERIKINKFKQYMEMYTKAIKTDNLINDGKEPEQVILTDNPHERWEIGFAVSDGAFQQVSFVNSIATTQGGTHVNYIADQIVDKLEEIVAKKNKGGVKLKKAQIRNHIFLFVNCLIVNPAFTGQTKEQMTTKVSSFGSKPQVSEKFLTAISKTEAVTNIIHFAQRKADKVLAKSDGSRRQRMNHAKLTDANKAGTKDGWRCTLILTEGDSASLLALAGRAVVNPDQFGVFPLRGKLLNVRDATIDQISKNEEIQNIKKFMGLQHKKEYTDTKSLRYGRLMIMTDQDHDGSHIKGLLINFLQVQFPSLLRLDGFLLEFITPIVKTWLGDPKTTKHKADFFTMPEYQAFMQDPAHKNWEHKYYKGLGTSDTSDAKIYFQDLDRHLKEFHTMKDEEVELIDLAFSKKKADARKTWLQKFVPGTYLDMASMDKISYDDFINKELILFSMADNQRSIPSVIDGFKPGQRKVLFTCFKKNIKKDTKVVSLAGSVSETTAYPYGETSLQQTIVGLAQNFVGSNNMNCLEPSGNFGSRLQGGQDAASPRYVYTRLSPFARRVFHRSDEALLTYNTDDGKQIEPEFYLPIVPMVLINGADGIGTGWSTSIPNYNPEDVIENLKLRMNGDSKSSMKMMKPWFRGWTGETEDMGNDRYKFSGRITESGDQEVEITELPVRMWTQDFKNRLEDIIKAEKTPSFIKDYTEYNTPETIHFIIKLVESKKIDCSDERNLEDLFKLTKTMATSNMVAFDAQGRIHRYETVLDIMEEFYQVRLHMYQKRKQFLLNDMQRELERFSNQARFIKMIIDNKLTVSKKRKPVLVAELQKLGFARFPKVIEAKKSGETEDAEDDDNDAAEDDELVAGANDFDYLLGMAIWSLTQERVEKLQQQIGSKEEEINALTKKTVKSLWEDDLDDLLEEWRKQLAEEEKREKKIRSKGRRASAKLGIAGKASRKRKGGDNDDDSDDSFVATKKAKTTSKMKSAMAGLLALDGGATKPASKALLINGVEQKPVMPPPAETIEVEMQTSSAPQRATSAKPVPSRPAKQAKSAPVLPKTEDSDEDIFAAVAKEAARPVAHRAGRAASQKKTYKMADDSDEDMSDGVDAMLDDVSSMVKGIGAGAGQGTSRFFHPPSGKKPSTIADIKVKPKKLGAASTIADQTDWEALAQDSPQKTAAQHSIISDDDNDDMSRSKPSAAAVKVKPAAAKAKRTQSSKSVAAPESSESKVKQDELVLNGTDDDIVLIRSKATSRVAARPGRQAARKPKYAASEDESEADSDGYDGE